MRRPRGCARTCHETIGVLSARWHDRDAGSCRRISSWDVLPWESPRILLYSSPAQAICKQTTQSRAPQLSASRAGRTRPKRSCPKGRASRDEVIVSSSLVQLKKFIFASGSSSTRGQCGLCGGGGGTLRLHVARVALTKAYGLSSLGYTYRLRETMYPILCVLISIKLCLYSRSVRPFSPEGT